MSCLLENKLSDVNEKNTHEEHISYIAASRGDLKRVQMLVGKVMIARLPMS